MFSARTWKYIWYQSNKLPLGWKWLLLWVSINFPGYDFCQYKSAWQGVDEIEISVTMYRRRVPVWQGRVVMWGGEWRGRSLTSHRHRHSRASVSRGTTRRSPHYTLHTLHCNNTQDLCLVSFHYSLVNSHCFSWNDVISTYVTVAWAGGSGGVGGDRELGGDVNRGLSLQTSLTQIIFSEYLGVDGWMVIWAGVFKDFPRWTDCPLHW